MFSDKTHVLIIDDERSSVEVICALLESYVNLHFAQNSEDALDILQNNKIDLVLMDVELPDISGFDLTKQIKALDKYTHLPIIFLSGYQDLMFEVQAFEAGAIDYLVKPISPIRLLLRVNAHLKLDMPIPGF